MASSKSSSITIGILVAILLLGFWYLSLVQQKEEVRQTKASPVARSLSGVGSYTDISGAPIHLEGYIGKKVVAVSWASWCPACVNQLIQLNTIVGEKADVSILAFNRAETIDTAKAFLEHYQLGSNLTLVIDPTDAFFTSIGGYAMPEIIFYHTSGEIAHHQRGELTETRLRQLIKNLQ